MNKVGRIYPHNKSCQYNYKKFNNYHNFLVLVIIGIMVWLIINDYHNFLNMFLLFTVAQIVINYQKNLYKKYN